MIIPEVMRSGSVLNYFDGRTTGFATGFDVEQVRKERQASLIVHCEKCCVETGTEC